MARARMRGGDVFELPHVLYNLFFNEVPPEEGHSIIGILF